MKLINKTISYLVILLAISALGISDVSAAINPMINYQGRLTDSSGVAVTNGSYNMRFRLYTSATGGSPIFTETLTGNNRHPVVSGLFSVMVGSTTDISAIDFSQTLYLGVEIGGTDNVTPTWDGEMSPRKIIGSVPSAFVAKNLDGGSATTSNLLVTSSTTLQNFTGVNATTSNIFSTSGTITSLIATTLTSGLINGQTISSAANFTGTLTAISGLTNLSNLLLNGSTTLQNFTGVNSTTTNATSTTFAVTTLCLTGDTCRTTWPTGGGSSFAFPFTTLGTGENATGTTIVFNNGFLSNSSSTLANLTFSLATGTSATTTNFFADNLTGTTLSSTNFSNTNSTSTNATTTEFYVSGSASTTNIRANTGVIGYLTSVFSSISNLLVNGSTTLQNFTATNGTTTSATSTGLYVSSYFAGAGLSTCNTSSDKLLWLNGTFSCGTDQTGGGGGTDVNWTFFNGSGIRLATTTNQVLIGFTSTSSLSKLEVVGGATFDISTTTSATTTNLAVTTLCLTGDTCRTTWPTGGSGGNSKWATTTDNTGVILNSAFRVGLGTTTPNWLLQLATSTAPQLVLSDSTAGSQGWAFRNLDGNLFISSTSPTTYATGTTPAITITRSGTIGFNNQNPTRNLNINSNAGNNASIAITALTGSSFITFSSATTNWSTGLDLSASNSFKISHSNGVGTTDRLTINSSGSIGIGTTTPQWLLQLSTTSAPQLTLSDSATPTANHWSFRNSGGIFYLATSSPSSFATSTVAAVTIDANGVMSIPNSATTSEIRANTGVVGYLTSIFGSLTNLLVTSSSTLQNFTYTNATGTSATTTGFAISGVTSSVLKTNSSGSVVPAVAGTDYQALISATYPILFNSNTLSLAFGTTTNNVWGGEQTFTASSTLQNFTFTNATGTQATTTNFYSTSIFGGVGNLNTLNVNNDALVVDSGKYVGVGTTTPRWLLQLASSTAPQLVLSGGDTSNGWAFRNSGGIFYLATSSPTSFATNTLPVLSVNSGGGVGIRTASALNNSAFNIAVNASVNNATNGILMLGTTALSSPSVNGTFFGVNAPSTFSGNFLDLQVNGTRNFSLSSSGSITTLGGVAAQLDGSTLGIYSPSGGTVTVGNTGDVLASNLVLQAGSGGSGSNMSFVTDAVTRASLSVMGFGIGTTTPRWLLQLASSTAPQLTLSDGGATHWSFRSLGGNFYLATSSASTFATSSEVALAINANGNVGIASSTPSFKLDVAGFINTNMYGGFKQEGHTILFASTTNASILLGQQAGQNLRVDGLNSTAVGYQALRVATSSDDNTAIGYQALTANTIGHSNTAVGRSALAANITGADGVAIGESALEQNTYGASNTAVGFRALRLNTTGGTNTAIGSGVLAANLTGSSNSVLGGNALGESITGSNNVAIGYQALQNNQSATSTVAIGYGAALGGANYTNQRGTYIGHSAGTAILTGSDNNTFIGYQAGNAVTTGSGNLLIGYDVDSLNTDINNYMNIGNVIYGTSITGTGTTTAGFLGVGTTTPRYLLQLATTTAPQLVISGEATSNNWAFRNSGGNFYLATSSPTSFATSTISSLMIDGTTGNVGIGTTTPGAKLNIIGALCVDDSTPTCANAERAEGTIYSVAALSSSLDLAESYPTRDMTLSAGEIVMLDNTNPMFVSRGLASSTTPLIGIVSTNPGFWLGGFNDEVFRHEKKLPIALSGRVPTKVNSEGGEINIGDRIALSSVPGVGKKATSTDYTVGIALESMYTSSGTIEVFVNLSNPLKSRDLVEVENRVSALELNLSTASVGLQVSTTTNSSGSSLIGAVLQALGATISDAIVTIKNLVVEVMTVGSSENPTGITFFDTVTGEPYCFSIANGSPVTTQGACDTQVAEGGVVSIQEDNTSNNSSGESQIDQVVENNNETVPAEESIVDDGEVNPSTNDSNEVENTDSNTQTQPDTTSEAGV